MKKPCALFFVLIGLAACEPQMEELSPSAGKRMDFLVPAALTNKTVDLNNKQSVAKALGVTLNGSGDQHLYDIVMSAPSSEGKLVKRTIPIRVDNIKQGSDIIYSVEGSNYEAPKKKRS